LTVARVQRSAWARKGIEIVTEELERAREQFEAANDKKALQRLWIVESTARTSR
jgi:hypothetical protein